MTIQDLTKQDYFEERLLTNAIAMAKRSFWVGSTRFFKHRLEQMGANVSLQPDFLGEAFEGTTILRVAVLLKTGAMGFSSPKAMNLWKDQPEFWQSRLSLELLQEALEMAVAKGLAMAQEKDAALEEQEVG